MTMLKGLVSHLIFIRQTNSNPNRLIRDLVFTSPDRLISHLVFTRQTDPKSNNQKEYMHSRQDQLTFHLIFIRQINSRPDRPIRNDVLDTALESNIGKFSKYWEKRELLLEYKEFRFKDQGALS